MAEPSIREYVLRNCAHCGGIPELRKHRRPDRSGLFECFGLFGSTTLLYRIRCSRCLYSLPMNPSLDAAVKMWIDTNDLAEKVREKKAADVIEFLKEKIRNA